MTMSLADRSSKTVKIKVLPIAGMNAVMYLFNTVAVFIVIQWRTACFMLVKRLRLFFVRMPMFVGVVALCY